MRERWVRCLSPRVVVVVAVVVVVVVVVGDDALLGDVIPLGRETEV